MRPGSLSRRGFLERSLAALTAAGVPLWHAREVVAANEATLARRARRVSANDRVVMGAIGTGSRGVPVMADAWRREGVEFVAICDVDAKHRRDCKTELAKSKVEKIAAGADKLEEYGDFRELLARPDIDAVTIVTPDHWHALVAVEAMRRGKDVYCEKPLTLTLNEGRAMVETARANKTVFQTGSQQRSDARFRLACELVRNGRLGAIRRVETRIGQNPRGGPFPEKPVPEGLDWNFWLGPTPEVPYREMNCHYEFRWWRAYSGGKMTDWGAHHNDIAQWALGKDDTGPVSVRGEGEEPAREPGYYDWHPDFRVEYAYADGVELVCMAKGENGVKFEGEKGWIFVSRSKIEASDPALIEEPLPGDAVRLYHSNDHMGNFMSCLATRERPICDVEIGHRSVSVCHIGNIALLLGRELRWDPAAERFLDDEDANRMLFRPYRSPWTLEA